MKKKWEGERQTAGEDKKKELKNEKRVNADGEKEKQMSHCSSREKTGK